MGGVLWYAAVMTAGATICKHITQMVEQHGWVVFWWDDNKGGGGHVLQRPTRGHAQWQAASLPHFGGKKHAAHRS